MIYLVSRSILVRNAAKTMLLGLSGATPRLAGGAMQVLIVQILRLDAEHVVAQMAAPGEH